MYVPLFPKREADVIMIGKIHFKISHVQISLRSLCVSQSVDTKSEIAVRTPENGSLALARLRTMGFLCMEYSHPVSFHP